MTNRLNDPEVLLAILDNLPNSVVIKDSNLRFVLANRVHNEMLGCSESELLGKSDLDIWPEEQANAFVANDTYVMQTGEVSVTEESATNSDGYTNILLTRKSRLQTSDGNSYLLCSNTDISALRRREEQYKSLTENIPLGVVQIDADMRVLFANPLFKLYCGGSGSEFEQERILRKLSESNPSFPGRACKFETEIQGLGSEPRTVVAISSGWQATGERGQSATVSIIDITQIAELQRVNSEISRLNNDLAANVRKLKEAQDELVKKGRMEQLGQLTATVAHELRNPLGAVRTSAFLLQRKTKDSGLGLESLLERINKGITRCDDIITQLLDFSRNKQLVCKPEKLDEWLSGVMEEEARSLPAAISVELVLGLSDREVPFDPGRLQRAVVNLVHNAVEAMVGKPDQPLAKATPNPSIIVSTFYKDGHVSLRVVDNGPGMTPEILERIRDPLFTTKSFGTGLGVPAVEQIAVQHGGRLDVASTVGVGSSFTVWLPAPDRASDVAA